MPRRERHEWSIPVVKAAEKLKVVRVIHIHIGKRSAEYSLGHAIDARCKKNCLRHVKPNVRQTRHSRQAACRIKTRANYKWTWPAEEREIVRGVPQIIASLESLLLQVPGGPCVERRDG
jgi:hypothetical protein